MSNAKGGTILAKKTFEDWELRFIHSDIKKLLAADADVTSRGYRFVAVDRATCWVFIDSYSGISQR